MTGLYETRRYLTNFEPRRVPHIFTDVLVIGGGVAGACAAIEAARHGQVLLVTKGELEQSNTWQAQGGVAVVLDKSDSFEAHVADTLRVGCGLCAREAVEKVVREGPDRIQDLLDWGANFDRQDGKLVFGREGGHGVNRVLHARGDATGQEVAATLIRRVREDPAIRIFEDCFVIDLLGVDQQCIGVVSYHPKYGHQLLWAKQTILSSGGTGRLYRETTNPEIATGDGLAMAYRSGAILEDMEMMQFHPTTLYVAGATRALISEAVRGEGAHLIDRKGHRFMPEFHPDAELAPRDVVSRAILTQLARTGATSVYLDVRHLGSDKFAARFPQIAQLCEEFDIDVAREGIPVRPSAHYMVGGVAVDLEGRTNVANLLACGEVACTGLHGANRLASNSLLEGLVFGQIAGRTAGAALADLPNQQRPADVRSQIEPSLRTALDLPDVRNSLRSVMWRNVGIERVGERLAETVEIIEFWARYVLDKLFDEPGGWELQNMLTVGRLVTMSAAARLESRGVHFRTDLPETDDVRWRCHIQLQRQDTGPKRTLRPCED